MLGLQFLISTDNFETITAGTTLHWALAYFGDYEPFFDVGPVYRYDFAVDEGSVGARLDVGVEHLFGAAYLETEYFFQNNMLFTISAGVRFDWGLFYLI